MRRDVIYSTYATCRVKSNPARPLGAAHASNRRSSRVSQRSSDGACVVKWQMIAGWVLVFAFLGGAVVGGLGWSVLEPRADPVPRSVYAQVSGSVVNVLVSHPEPRVGTGFSVDPTHVVTAWHLVVGTDRVKLVTEDGRQLVGKVIGTDARADLALLEVIGGELDSATLGSSLALRTGDTALAIGNPYGLAHTLSVGVVGNVGRRLELGGTAPRVGFIQLTMPLNPGNSGGPVFDAHGEVIGVLVGTHAQGQSIAFAVPVEILVETMPALRAGERVTRGFLGLRIAESDEGLEVSWVIPSGPAGLAGVRVGDTILRVGDRPVYTRDELSMVMDGLHVGVPVAMNVLRDEREVRLELVPTDWADHPVVVVGMTLRPSPGTGGRVVALRPRSRAELSGVREGDQVRTIDGVPVGAPAEVHARLSGGGPARLGLLRGGSSVEVELVDAR
ncbi:MAG: serine protease Do [Kiritimatiellia bacterium]